LIGSSETLFIKEDKTSEGVVNMVMGSDTFTPTKTGIEILLLEPTFSTLPKNISEDKISFFDLSP
jgi:hypothetical protein